MPVGDWQFWVVTVVFVIALWLMVRPFVRRRDRGTRVRLTIDKSDPD